MVNLQYNIEIDSQNKFKYLLKNKCDAALIDLN